MRYLFLEIPKEKRFLLRYFKGKIQRYFLRYFIFFGDYKNFVDHTGLCCSVRWLKNLEKKYNDLMYLQSVCKSNMHLELLSDLEAGKINISGNVKKFLKDVEQ
jgi:hypothetical protein